MKNPTYLLPSSQYKRKATIFSVLSIIVIGCCWFVEFNPFGFFSEFHFVQDLLSEMFPPNFEIIWDDNSMAMSILQTLSMAFLGTFYGGFVAIILSFLSATPTMPIVWIRNLTKFILSLIRVIPSLVIILIFVIAVGPGAFAGVLTLVITTIGTFGKLFTETIDNTENPAGEAIFSVGSNRVQMIKYSIVPQILPSFIGNLLYAFDINMRAAIGLGIFGGGGIGYKLHMAMRVLHYKDATALIALIIILVTIVEKISNTLRKRVI